MKSKTILVLIILVIILVFGYDEIKKLGLKDLKDTVDINHCPKELPGTITIWRKNNLEKFVNYPKGLISLKKEDALRMFDPLCRSGSYEGENINYYYCNNFIWDLTEKTIDVEGNIKINYQVYELSLILKPRNETWIVGYSCSLLDPSCHIPASIGSYENHTIIEAICKKSNLKREDIL